MMDALTELAGKLREQLAQVDDDLEQIDADAAKVRAERDARIAEANEKLADVAERKRALTAERRTLSKLLAVAGVDVPALGTLTCGECGDGRTFQTAAGLGSHRRRMHGIAGKHTTTKAATQPSPEVEQPAPPAPKSNRVVPAYGCDECDAEFTSRGDPARHRLADHPDDEEE